MKLIVLGAMFAAIVVLSGCGGDGRLPAGSPTPGPARFPVVLDHDMRVTAQADGSGFNEESIAQGTAESSDGNRRVSVVDGRVMIESSDGAGSVVIEGVRSERAWVNPVWSPDGTRVLFDTQSDGSPSLYIVRADGSGLLDLGDGLDGDTFPLAWSPDGERVAFGVQALASGSASKLYVARADGSGRAMVGDFTNPQGDGGWDRPRFSPDGSKIAAFGEGLSLRIFDAAGGPARDLAPGQVTKFSWAPDGRSLAFDSNDAGTQQSMLYVADAASGYAAVLAAGWQPRWSPAGDRIAFKRGTSALLSEVRMIRPDGSDDVSVGPPGYYAFSELMWTADGSRLLFTRPAFGPAQLYRVDLEGAVATAVGSPMGEAGGPPQSVSISPDGREVVFLSGAFWPEGGWYVQDLASGASKLLYGGGFPFASIGWTADGPMLVSGGPSLTVTEPGGSARSLGLERVSSVRLSPDGSRIAAATVDDLWIIATDGSDRRRIFDGDATSDIVQRVDWAPDGKGVSYTVTTGDGATGATVQRAFISNPGGARIDVTGTGGTGDLPYWSPAGDTLAQVRVLDDGSRELWLMDDGGANQRMLARLGASCCDAIYWSPDGARIAGSMPGGVSIIDAVTGAVAPPITTGGGCNVGVAGWSSDGSALYVYPACYGGH